MPDWATLLLGIIEGITEFLPISSTGHLLIAEHWLGPRSEMFNVVIQSGAMLAVTALYWRRLVALGDWRVRASRIYVGKLALAFCVSSLLGLIVKKLGVGLPDALTPVAWAMILGGVWIVGAEWYAVRQAAQTEVTWKTAIVVGLAQVVAAIFPGTSRSGATIFAAMLSGTTDRQAATEFAFLVGIPTMYAASAYEFHANLQAQGTPNEWGALLYGFVAAAITAFIAVRWLLGFIKTHRFTAFAIYRLIVGAGLLALLS
ncbi:MAG: undecaprenyl-diphosphate phosphatase [Bosea sp. (in: a-proteobacteria)]|uniref:undecaprenyl-diphosphate phosphatase n=1 Tax=Bosea sp. (in: a-proteobacteria) TaxID=1871050 RepID=UPI003F7C7EF4